MSMQVHAIYDGDTFVQGYWLLLENAADKCAEIQRGTVRSFDLLDAPDATWPLDDAVKFMLEHVRRTYLVDLFDRVASFHEACRRANIGQRHMRRLMALLGLKRLRHARTPPRSFIAGRVGGGSAAVAAAGLASVHVDVEPDTAMGDAE